jgi:hypothetical protein
MSSPKSLCDRFFLLITDRYFLFAVNVAIVFISFACLHEMLPLLYNVENNLVELEDIVENLGVILIGYGVAVEERSSFMPIFRLYPRFKSELQSQIDHHCHEYGLCYLLLGLMLEVCVALIKIPNRVIDTEKLEVAIYLMAIVFLLWNAGLMLRHCWRLYRPWHEAS